MRMSEEPAHCAGFMDLGFTELFPLTAFCFLHQQVVISTINPSVHSAVNQSDTLF